MAENETNTQETFTTTLPINDDALITSYKWKNGEMTRIETFGVEYAEYLSGNVTETRTYMNIAKPQWLDNVIIKKAEIVFDCYTGGGSADGKISMHNVTGTLADGDCTPAFESTVLGYLYKKEERSSTSIILCADVTDIFKQLKGGQITSKKLVVKTAGEEVNVSFSKPYLSICYETKYGFDESRSYHTHELGRFGQGNIDLANGNLIFDSEDFAFAGNRMPVTIKHLYNSTLADKQYTNNDSILNYTANFGSMKIGNGYKLNLMQSMVFLPNVKKYIYVDENGNETVFKSNYKPDLIDDVVYSVFESENDSNAVYRTYNKTLTLDDKEYKFDDNGRLIRITDSEHTQNSINYTYTDGKLTSVTDGAGRAFAFGYTGDYLTTITAPDNTAVAYAYEGDFLKTVTYPDGRKAQITYVSNYPSSVMLYDAQNTPVYKVDYEFTNGKLSRVTEFGVDVDLFVMGASTAYNYSADGGKTTATITEPMDASLGETADTVRHAVYAFDDNDQLVSEYIYSDDMDKTAASGEAGINPYDAQNNVESNVDNLLLNHNFANGTDHWTKQFLYENNIVLETSQEYGYGKSSLYIDATQYLCEEEGVYQQYDNLPAGEYTFSAYVATEHYENCYEPLTAQLRVMDSYGNIIGTSEVLKGTVSDFTRLIIPFVLTETRTVQCQLVINNMGKITFNAPQLENNSFVNRYNYMVNGNFERGTAGWDGITSANISTQHSFNMSKSLCLKGEQLNIENYVNKKTATQTIYVNDKASVLETFTLSAWAKGVNLKKEQETEEKKPAFNVTATIVYIDGTEDNPYPAEFSYNTDEWQHASITFSKAKAERASKIIVSCNVDYSIGTAYFDNVSLFRDSVQTGISEADLASTEVADDGEESASDIDTKDFEELFDAYGNPRTETTFTDGQFGALYRNFTYNDKNGTMNNAGNDLVTETDTRGNRTQYIVDPLTSRNQAVIDRLGNKTEYEYDAAGKTTKVTSKKADDTQLAQVSYAYDAFDNLTEITRGDGMKYSLKYNEFHKLQSIGIDGKTDGDLITYSYKKGSGRLKEISYANGYKMQATYNQNGQMVAEIWYNAYGGMTSHYKYVYDNAGNLVRSIDINLCKEYNYIYENDKIVCAYEYNVTLDSAQSVTSKTVVNTIKYAYDEQDRVVKKTIITGENTVEYKTSYPENSEPVVTVSYGQVDGKVVRSQSKNDHLGRKEFDELQTGIRSYYRKFSYHKGDENSLAAEGKAHSAATTDLVSRIEYPNGRTIEYEYDKEERITKVTDSVDGVTEYTYDALGQLLTETKNGTVINQMTYDNYGNILTKNGTEFAHGKYYEYDVVGGTVSEELAWKDLLTYCDGQKITYDAQGNMVYKGFDYFCWEKGRQLQFMEKNLLLNTFTYNANGIRTSKNCANVQHDYQLDGTKILKETWDNNTLIPLYDNEDSVCGAFYNGMTYYFEKNLQGDVIAVYDEFDNLAVSYTYDAWGKVTKTVHISPYTDFADINPFLYRGYYYDWETGLYYLQSRYYDPELGRFINGDSATIILTESQQLGINLFNYCYNSPIVLTDPIGYQPKWAQAISRYAKGTKAYKTFLLATQKGCFSNLFWIAGFFRTSDGVYHTRQDCWQRFFGYNGLYDWAFNLGTDMQKDTFKFVSGKKEYVFWVWKGDYLNLGAGAELGFYSRMVVKGRKTEHWFAETKSALSMSMTLKLNGRTIASYKPNSKQWWITSFNPYYQNVKASRLTAVFNIKFSANKSLFKNFYNKFGIGTDKSNKWKFNKNNYKATLTF